MSIVLILVLLAVLFYGVSPLLILFTQTMKARPALDNLSPNNLPPPLVEYMYNNAGALRDIGFLPEGYFSVRDAMPGAQSHLIMLTRRASGDKAMVTLITTPQMNTRYVEFSTRFSSGRSVDTSTITMPGSFKDTAQETKTYLPRLTNLAELYAIHRFVIEKELAIGPDDAPVIYPVGQAHEYLVTQAFEEGYERQVQTGLLRRTEDSSGTVYRPTLYGAYYMTWKLFFPFKQLELARRAKRAEQVLTAFRASGRSPIAR